MLAGAGVPASDMHLGRVAGSADAVPSSLTFEPANPSVSVRVSNTSGKPGVVVGRLGGRVATAVAPSHSSIVTLTWDGPAAAGDDSGVLRLELYPEGETAQPADVEEHPYAVGAGYQPSPSPKPSYSMSPSPWPKPSGSMSKSPSPKPSRSMSKSPKPKPSGSMSESPKPSGSASSTPSPTGVLPRTGAGTSLLAVIGGGSLLFGTFVLGLAWVLRRRFLRDKLSC